MPQQEHLGRRHQVVGAADALLGGDVEDALAALGCSENGSCSEGFPHWRFDSVV